MELSLPELEAKIVGSICASFPFKKENSPNKTNPVILTLNGKRIILISGKSLWSNPSYAKSALRNHIKHILCQKNIYPDKSTVDKYLAMVLEIVKIEPIK